MWLVVGVIVMGFVAGSDGGGWQWVANLESKSRRSRRVRGSILVVLGVPICRMWVGDDGSWGYDSQDVGNGYISDILFYCIFLSSHIRSFIKLVMNSKNVKNTPNLIR